MMQSDLFAKPMQARARRSDPLPSHTAAHGIEATGKAGQQRVMAFGAVLRHPGMTAAELAKAIAKDALEQQLIYRALGRRLPELRGAGVIANGPVRECAVTGRLGQTWRVA